MTDTSQSKSPSSLTTLDTIDLTIMRSALEPMALSNMVWLASGAYVGWLRFRGRDEASDDINPFAEPVIDNAMTNDRRFMLLRSAEVVAHSVHKIVHQFDGSKESALKSTESLLTYIHNDELAKSCLREAFGLFRRFLELGEGLRASSDLAPIFAQAIGRTMHNIDDIRALGDGFAASSKYSSDQLQLIITGQMTQVMRDKAWNSRQYSFEDALVYLKCFGEILGLGDNANLNAALPKGLFDSTVLAWFAYMQNIIVLSPLALVSIGVATQIYPSFSYLSKEDGELVSFSVGHES